MDYNDFNFALYHYKIPILTTHGLISENCDCILPGKFMTFHARARNIIFPNSFYVKFYNSINSGMHITHKKGEKLCRVSFISFHKYIKKLFRCLILSKDPQHTIIEPREI